MKTKPTQSASRTLNSAGIQADFIIARSTHMLDKKRQEKLAIFCGIRADHAISAPDVDMIYRIPQLLDAQHLGDKLLRRLQLRPRPTKLASWNAMVRRARQAHKTVQIAIVGKYFGTGDYTLSDSYISVIEAIKHAAWSVNHKPVLTWIDSEVYERAPHKVKELQKYLNEKQYPSGIVDGIFGKKTLKAVKDFQKASGLTSDGIVGPITRMKINELNK